MAALPNRRYSGHCKATEEEATKEYLEKRSILEQEMQTAGYITYYVQRKMEVAAQDKAG